MEAVAVATTKQKNLQKVFSRAAADSVRQLKMLILSNPNATTIAKKYCCGSKSSIGLNDGRSRMRRRRRREKPAWLATKKGAEVASFAARQHLSLSLTLIAFVCAMPTQQSKCDVQHQPDSEVLECAT